MPGFWLMGRLSVMGSADRVAKELRQAPCNGWEQWYYLDEQTGECLPIV